jgi:hypothetical protein
MPHHVFNDPPQMGRLVLELLRGHWAIERQIEPGGYFTGNAVFTPRSRDSLLYRESGRLVLDDGTTLEASNSYIYTLRNGDIDISFASGVNEGQHFIDISLPHGSPGGFPIVSVDRHLCRLDTYDAVFRIENPALFTMTYVVIGPAKDYVSRSAFRRPA